VRTIAFPAISCGVYGYPIPGAARIAIDTTASFLEENKILTAVIFACFGHDVFRAFQAALGN
jgi:O-acetyl-ADP-ribose deacetylase (regulator of RNase III)